MALKIIKDTNKALYSYLYNLNILKFYIDLFIFFTKLRNIRII